MGLTGPLIRFCVFVTLQGIFSALEARNLKNFLIDSYDLSVKDINPSTCYFNVILHRLIYIFLLVAL